MAVGVFRGSGATGEIAAFETWAGRPVTHVLDFVGLGIDWTKINRPAWWLNRHAGKPWQLVLSTAMLPNRTYTLAAGAQGKYDAHWTKFFTAVAQRYPTVIVRLGWEFNGRFYPWAAGGKEAAFAAYWRRIVTIARKVAPQVRFDWCPLRGNTGANVEACYPGDPYVDIVGLDAYDTAKPGLVGDARWDFQRTRPYGLDWHRTFAAKHGKPRSFPEWGITVRPNDQLGGGDNPNYIRHMRAETVEFACYFEVDAGDASHRLMTGQFPKAAEEFRT